VNSTTNPYPINKQKIATPQKDFKRAQYKYSKIDVGSLRQRMIKPT